MEGLRADLRDLGYLEGRNLLIGFSMAEDNDSRLLELAAELASLKVDVIVTPGTPATRAAQKATTTIPIVFFAVSDPVGGPPAQRI